MQLPFCFSQELGNPNMEEGKQTMKLSELPVGSTATIEVVGGQGALRHHFLDMGLIQGTEVTVVKYAPMGDPIELRIHGYELTIRLDDAKILKSGRLISRRRPKERRPDRKSIIRATGRAASFMTAKAKSRFRTVRSSPLPWWETRTAAKPHCSTSLPVPGSMWGIFPA